VIYRDIVQQPIIVDTMGLILDAISRNPPRYCNCLKSLTSVIFGLIPSAHSLV
jgi:hypothetical protein